MKLYIKTIAAITVLLFFSIGMKADPTINIIKMLNGSVATETTATGDITTQIANGKCTLTVTPASGNYITAEKITYIKTINGSHAQTRTPDLDNEPIAVTALTPNADPSGETTYEFAIEDVYDYEITADFQSRKSIESAVITLANSSYTYTGEAHEPTVTVKLGETTLKLDVDYSVAYLNNKDAGEGTITVTGQRTYTATKTTQFTINKATITPKVTIAGWTYGATANTPSVSGNTGNGEVTYAYKLQNEAESAFATAVPTNAGAYTVKASIAATANYEAASDTAQFVIAKATPTLSFSATTASLTMDEEVTGLPTLSNPSGLAVTYTSSNSEVATVSEDGTVTPVAPGETTISATIATSNNYEGISASYVLTVNKSKRYGLKVGDTEVTEDNAEDILGAASDPDQPLYLYNPKTNTLIINKDQRGTAVIESRLPELKIYLMEISAIKRIFYNNQGDANNTGKLIFTCNGNVPGRLYLVNNEGESAITGFSDISYEYHLTAFEPDGVEYKDGKMQYAEKDEDDNPTGNIIAAHKVTIGQVIVPTTKEETITFDGTQFVQTDENGKVITDENGNPVPVDLSNFTYTPASETGETGQAKMLITLNTDASDPNSGNGYGVDDGEPGIYFGDTMTDKDAGDVADKVENNNLVPGGESYATNYDGFTFILPAGEGTVIVDEEVDEGYEFHLKIGTDTPITLKEGKPGRAQDEIEYKVSAPTYCYLYMVEKAFSARRAAARGGHGTRLGKRDRAHGKIFSVTVSPNKLSAANTPAQASGGIIPPSEEQGDEIETEGIQGVKVVNTVDDRWFTIDGRHIDKPTQKGLYIHNRKKVVVK